LDKQRLDMTIETAATKLGDPPIDLGLRMTDDVFPCHRRLLDSA
jgi:hypothetical protein